MNYFKICLFLLTIIFIGGCTKTNVLEDPPAGPDPNIPTGDNKPAGILYVNGIDSFYKINARNGAIIWTSSNRNIANSYTNPICFDSGTFYHGNHTGVTAYSTQTGISRWWSYWFTLSDADGFKEPVIKDSLIFITAPTSSWKHGYLFCMGKAAGTLHWQQRIDSGDVGRTFNTTPMIMGSNVVVATRDAANHKYLTAFSISNGSKQWSSAANDSLALKLKFADGKIYSTSHKNVYCYSATDGSLLWTSDLAQASYKDAYMFFDQQKLVLVKVANEAYSIATIDINNGKLLSRTTLAMNSYATTDCDYYKNTLFVTRHPTADSISISAFDLSSLSAKWERRFPCYIYSLSRPLITDKYCIVPIGSADPFGDDTMFFLDLNGNVISSFPLYSDNTEDLLYVENGTVYKMDRRFVNN
jgi:outer membrane protein assembly factor BamB